MQDEISVTLDEDDFIEAYRSERRPRRLASLLLLLALMLALLIAALLWRFPEARLSYLASPLLNGLTGAVILAATSVVALIIATPWLRRRAAHSTLEHHPGMRDPVRFTFDQEFFTVYSTYSQARYPWFELWDWRESERVLVVMPTPRNFYVVPKRGVDPTVLDRMRGYLGHARKRVLGRIESDRRRDL